MPFDFCINAPAKVNIGLKVLKKVSSQSKYHNIESIFQTISYQDELKIKKIDEKKCIVRCEQMTLPLENTLTKTYEAFCGKTDIDFGIEIELKKNIPAGGGLGGGSSDGAALLKALSELSKIPLTESLSCYVANQVGSDVFFFLLSGFFENGQACALVSGRGEIIEKISPRKDLFFILIFLEIHSSTKEAYTLIDEAYENNSESEDAFPDFSEFKNMYYDNLENWNFSNSFTSVLVRKYPAIGNALQDIISYGASWADMSGSGSTVFGIFESEKSAKTAFQKCRKKWRCVLAH